MDQLKKPWIKCSPFVPWFFCFSVVFQKCKWYIDRAWSQLSKLHYSSWELDKNIHKKSWLQKHTNNGPKIVEPPAMSRKFRFCTAYCTEVCAGMQNLLACLQPLNYYQVACSSTPKIKDLWAKFQICVRVYGSLWERFCGREFVGDCPTNSPTNYQKLLLVHSCHQHSDVPSRLWQWDVLTPFTAWYSWSHQERRGICP